MFTDHKSISIYLEARTLFKIFNFMVPSPYKLNSDLYRAVATEWC